MMLKGENEMLTIKSVNRELKNKFGDGIEILKGDDGYIYFWGTKVDRCYTTSVMVSRLNRLSLKNWIDEAAKLVEESNSFWTEQWDSEKIILHRGSK